MNLIDVSEKLRDEVRSLKFSAPVAYVYHPLDYAWASHREYLQRFGNGKKEVVLVGMNPGPYGMAQTGIPFGNISTVRDWLEIDQAIERPRREHPKRPVLGLQCAREEVSGTRLWGWAAKKFGSPHSFFERFFVLNYCPLLFLDQQARNLTPDRFPAAETSRLLQSCDQALRSAIEILEPKIVIGVGAWAHSRVKTALQNQKIQTGTILHPSPASPAANRGWEQKAETQLRELGVKLSG